jgi:hypothetical protein
MTARSHWPLVVGFAATVLACGGDGAEPAIDRACDLATRADLEDVVGVPLLPAMPRDSRNCHFRSPTSVAPGARTELGFRLDVLTSDAEALAAYGSFADRYGGTSVPGVADAVSCSATDEAVAGGRLRFTVLRLGRRIVLISLTGEAPTCETTVAISRKVAARLKGVRSTTAGPRPCTLLKHPEVESVVGPLDPFDDEAEDCIAWARTADTEGAFPTHMMSLRVLSFASADDAATRFQARTAQLVGTDVANLGQRAHCTEAAKFYSLDHRVLHVLTGRRILQTTAIHQQATCEMAAALVAPALPRLP